MAQRSDGRETHKRLSVMFADVVGYTRLMEIDQDGTHARLHALMETLLWPGIRERGGRVVKSTGDGLLAAFEQSGAAAETAVRLQTRLVESAASWPVEHRLIFRFSLNIADAIVEEEDVYGDGVNVAARLQEIAEPGDIVCTAEFLDQSRAAFAGLPVADLGSLKLKNIARPVAASAIRIGSLRNLSAPAPFATARNEPSVAVMAFEPPGLARRDRFLAAAIADELTHTLAGIDGLFVISSGTSRRYRSGKADVRKVGRELDVRYVLGGTLRRAGDRLRVQSELFDCETGQIVRSDRFEDREERLFELQETVSLAAARMVAPHIREADLRRSLRKRPENLNAYELVLQATDHLFRLDRTAAGKARGFLQQAMTLDPGYAPACSYAAYWHIFGVGEGWSDDPARDAREAERLARMAIERNPRDALAIAMHGHVRAFLFRDFERADRILEDAVRAGPNCAMAWAMSSLTKGYRGQGEAAVANAEIALRLSPFDGHVFWIEGVLAQAYFVKGEFEAAAAWARRAFAKSASAQFNLRTLAASLVRLGRRDEARRAVNDLMAINPGFNLADYEASCPFTGILRQTWFSSLLEAGFPARSRHEG
jgi:class 3 adenylate cyclase/tetratricopeptide (TPR) repeat protein